MSKLPIVAIIGRPNTGKSTLFNRMIGRRQAIVSDIPGTTRDFITDRIETPDLDYLLVDTGGMGGGTTDTDFEDDVHAQSLLALTHADLILFVVNGREELTASDYAVVDELRKKRKRHVPVFLVVAKCDDVEKIDEALPRYFELGVADETFPVSAVHALGMDALEDGIRKALRAMHFGKPTKGRVGDAPRIAVVGKPNVGKSSLVNALMSEQQRSTSPRLTSAIPGTTRDSTDTIIRFHDKEYVFVDTAGLRKRSSMRYELESLSVLRTLRSLEEADVAVLVLDGVGGVSKQDKHIAGLAMSHGTGLILVVNKMDLLPPGTKEELQRLIAQAFPFCSWAPVLFCSAETRENLLDLFSVIEEVCENRSRRIPTPTMNRWFQDLLARYQPKGVGGKSLATKYVTQVDASPPTFAVFLRDPKRMQMSSLRFMERKLREEFAFVGTPVRWIKKESS